MAGAAEFVAGDDVAGCGVHLTVKVPERLSKVTEYTLLVDWYLAIDISRLSPGARMTVSFSVAAPSIIKVTLVLPGSSQALVTVT